MSFNKSFSLYRKKLRLNLNSLSYFSYNFLKPFLIVLYFFFLNFFELFFYIFHSRIHISKYYLQLKSYNNPSWGREEEKRVVEITGTKGGKNKLVQTVTILRDTDHDGIPDIDDEDDDNDGISDEQEVLDQTDPKDSTSFKVTKICYKVKG